MADCIGTDCKREVLQAEVERLRGIVQADLEEKAEAWGKIDRLKSELFNAQFLLSEEKRDREFAQIELRNYKAELRRVTGPREPPHCPTCDCPGPSPGASHGS